MAATSKKAAATKAASTKKTTAKTTPAKKTTAKTTTAKKPPAKKTPAKKTTEKATAKAPTTTPAKKTPAAKKRPAPAKKAPAAKTLPTKKSTATTMASTSPTDSGVAELPKPRFNKDGFGYTKDFDLAFVKEMYDMLHEERVRLTGQANRLEEEAHQLVEEAEMGDVQFDDEGGEGDTMVVERERDLALSAQARETVVEIDAALDRIKAGTYGYSVVSGRPLPKERLEAIPWASVLVEEKVGGIGRR